jgi:hypothetical protein
MVIWRASKLGHHAGGFVVVEEDLAKAPVVEKAGRCQGRPDLLSEDARELQIANKQA